MKRVTSQQGLDFIAKLEGVVLHVYKDVAGLDTIGIGHLIQPGEHFTTLTREEAYALLAVDVKRFEDALNKNARVPLSQNQFDALIAWAFNVGTAPIAKSGVMDALNAGRYGDVPQELLRWCKARVNGKVVVNKGLENRRRAEAALFVTPDEARAPAHEQDRLDDATLAQAQAALAMSLDRSVRAFFDDVDAEPESCA